MTEEQKCIGFLKTGIEYKRQGDLKEALNYYEKAFYANQFNKDVYKNFAKIYISIQQSDYAMKNLLTYAHLVKSQGILNMDSYDFAVSFYDWSGHLNESITIQKDIAIKGVTMDFNIAKIIADLNLTFQAGFCFLIKHRPNLTNLNLPANLMNNYIKTLLGQESDGPSLADTNASNMVRAIGLSYLLRNLFTDQNIPLEDITQIYLDRDFIVDDI